MTKMLDHSAAERELLDSSPSASTSSNSPSRSSRSSLIIKKRWRRSDDAIRTLFPLSISLIFILILASFVMFLLVALLKIRQEHSSCTLQGQNPMSLLVSEDVDKLESTSDLLMKTFDTTRIRRNLKWMSRNTHISGTTENSALMLRLADEYKRFGFQVRLYNYSVLLNYPDFDSPNTVEVQDENEKWWKASSGRGRPLGPPEAIRDQVDPRSYTWWNAYSGNGTAEGTLVYCNYGMREDFDFLDKNDIDIRGSIAIIRYGGIPRAAKVREAEQRGAIGVILFSDPVHYTGYDRNRTFPQDIYLPGTDAQRGSVLGTSGDPLTPLFPSLPYVHHSETIHTASEKGYLPKIPVTPVSYDDAERIFLSLNGDPVESSHWRGGLQSTYRFTGSRIFRISVNSKNVKRVITNVIASLPGKEEPDKWVMVGNHVDAWGHGAIDPLSGTAVQLEMARVAGKIFSHIPQRRSLVFCHWDAEEYGLIGSTEWIEEMQHLLNSRAVAYINVDHIAGNLSLDVKSVPQLFHVITSAASRVPHPNSEEMNSGRLSLLDAWKFHRGNGPISGDRFIADIGLPAGGSDYQRFIAFAGIPAADLKLESSPGRSYALYHSMYETFWAVDHLLDPHFVSFRAVGQLWLEVTHRLANQLVLPLDPFYLVQSLSSQFHRATGQLIQMNISYHIKNYHHKVDSIRDALRRFYIIAKEIQAEMKEISSGAASISVLNLSVLNSRLQSLERVFLDPFAFPNPIHRHILYSPSRHPSYSSSLSLLLDPAVDFLSTNQTKYLDELDLAFSRLQFSIESAIHVLSN